MSNQQKIGVILDVSAQVSKAEGSIENLKKSFEGIGGTKGNRLKDLLLDIGNQYDKLSDQSGKTMEKIGDFTKATKASDNFDSALKKIGKEITRIGQLSDKELKKLFPPEIAERVDKTSSAISTYNTMMKNSEKSKGAIGQATAAYQKQLEVVDQLQKELKELEDAKKSGTAVNASVRDTQRKSVQAAEKRYNDKIAEAQRLKDERDNYAIQKKLVSPSKSTVYMDKDKAYQSALEDAEKLRKAYEDTQAVLSKMYVPETVDKELSSIKTRLEEAKKASTDLGNKLESVKTTEMGKALDEAKKKLEGLTDIDLSKITKLEDLEKILDGFTTQGIDGVKKALAEAGIEIKKLDSANENIQGTIRDTTAEFERQNRAMEDVQGIKNRILQFFSLTNAMQLARQAIQKTFETVKELDAAMTETAVVTDFSIGDMWDELPRYTETAKQLGATTLGAYETMTLFYQQGLETNEVFEIGTETMKMARIAGLEYADATDLMTAALRGFNMELNEASAQRINDVYSELAAITAADTNEIANAMTKTASIANSANMEFETTAALLSQIIETTREPAETAGTAMKTIIARFTEMKKATSDIINVDGEEVSVNKVEAALKSAGVALRDVNGEFRDLDDVFLELSSKWNSLDKMTQRYVATMAAGSRQQSRFIAMMQDYDRTVELVDAAYGSAGASQQQFDKTLESLEAKLNRLQDAWNEFLMGLSNSTVIKGVVDLLTELLEAINKSTDGTDGLATFLSRLFTIVATFKIGKGIFDKIFQSINLEMFKGGQQGGQQLSRGVGQGVNQGIGQAIKGIASTIPKKIKSIFQTSKMVSTLPIQLKWDENGTMGVKQFAKTLSSQLTPEQMTGNLKNIGTVLETSVKTSLAAHGLQDEAVMWAKGLGDSFEAEMRKEGADIQKVIAQIMAQVQAQVANSKVEIILDDDGQPQNPEDMTKNQQKDNFLKDIDNNDFQIDDDMIPKTEKIEANIMGIGTALTTAAMATNLLASGLEESGAISEDASKTVKTLSSGLSTAGTMMMVLKTASDLFNISAAANPYLIGAAILIGVITTVASLIGQAAEKQKELNEQAMNFAKEQSDKVKENEDLIKSYDELLKTYEKTTDDVEELNETKKQLIDQFELEKQGINALTSSYEEVAEAAKQAQLQIIETSLTAQEAGIIGAVANMKTEGQAESGTGYNGNNFSIDIGNADDFDKLAEIIKELAQEEGIKDLSVNKDFFGNMDISGFSDSPEEQAIFAKVMSRALVEYQNQLSKSGISSENSTAYTELSTWYGKMDTYIQDIDLMLSEQQNNILALMQDDIDNTEADSFQDFEIKVNDLITKYSEMYGDILTEEEIRSAILDGFADSTDFNERYYSLALSKLDALPPNEKKNFQELFGEIDSSTAKIIAAMDIGPDNTAKEIVEKTVNQQVVEKVTGDIGFMKTMSSYMQEINSEEGLSEESKQGISSLIKDVPGTFQGGKTAVEYWESVKDLDKATQLDTLYEISERKNAAATEARAKILDKIPTNIKTTEDTEREQKASAAKSEAEDVWEAIKFFQDNKNQLKIAELYGFDPDKVDTYNSSKDAYNIYKQGPGNDIDYTKELIDHQNRNIANGKDPHKDAALLGLAATFDELIDSEDEKQKQIYNQNKSAGEAFATLFKGTDMTNGNVELNGATIDHLNTLVDFVNSGYSINGTDIQTLLTLSGGENAVKPYFTNEYQQALSGATFENTLEGNIGKILGEEYANAKYEELTGYQRYQVLDHNVKDYRGALAYQGLQFANWSKFGAEDNAYYNDTRTYEQIQAAVAKDEAEGKEPIEFIKDGESIDKYLNLLHEAGKVDLTKPWNEVVKTVNQLEEEDFDFEVEIDTDNAGRALKEVNDKIDALDEATNTLEEIAIQVDTAEIEAAISKMELMKAVAENLSNATSLIDTSNYQVDTEGFQQLQELYPQMLEGAKATKQGTIQLNKQIVDNVIQSKRAELQADVDAAKAKAETRKTELKNAITVLEQVKTGAASAAEGEAVLVTAIKNKQGQKEAEIAIDSANEGINASNTATTGISANVAKLSEQFDKFGLQLNEINEALDGGTYNSIKAPSVKGAASEYISTKKWDTDAEIKQHYVNAQSVLSEYDKYVKGKEGTGEEVQSLEDWAKAQSKDPDGNEPQWTDDVINEAATIYDATTDLIGEYQNELNNIDSNIVLMQAQVNGLQTPAQIEASNGSGGSKGSGDKDDKINYTNPTLENINEKLENLERRREKGEIDALDYENEKKGLLGLKQGILQKDLDKALANSKYKDYFGYDEATDSILLNEQKFNAADDKKKDAVMEEYNRIKDINDELNEIEDEIGEYAANANTVDTINAALEAIERKHENKDMDTVDYINERNALLSKKAIILQATLDDELANNTEKRFFYYDEVLDAVLINEEEFNKLSEDRQEEVRKEYEKIKSINDELNEIEDTLKDMEFRTPEDRQQYQLGEAMNWNAQGDLDSINRKRDELSRYDELIGKLPSEMQGPLTLMTGGMNMLYEAEESQVLRRQEEALRMELEAKERNAQFLDNGINDPNEAIYYYDPTTQSYKIHEDRFAGLKTQEERDAVMDEIEKMKGYVDAINEVQTQRSGGIFQKPFYLAEKSAKAMQKAFKNTGNTAKDVKDAFNDLEKALGLSETALDKFEGGLTEAIEQSGLKDKEIKGLGLLSDEQFNKLNNSKLGGFMGDNTKAFAQMLLGEGSTNGMDFANTGLGALSEMFGFTGDLMNFDMMGMGLDMLNTGKGMIEQGMQMVEKIIGYITQAVQVVVDAWTNREDYLYNFLQIIEKHLRDYEKLQREQNQIEKGRYASVDDIKENWDAQWKSLQTQLEEQTERLETRQKELERSRWNPFSLISGWDPSTDTLYENRTVKFAWDLFIGFGSMAPMGLGSLFGSLNQLYEDYDKRVQNSYEDRLAAEQAILDIEDQRLELVKAGSEQATEFEQRVMDAMVQKEQEQIEELTRLNDTISEANSKLIETLRSNLEKMRQERENEKTEEELGEKERRLAYLRQDTSGANMMEIKKLEEQLEEGHESYTDKLIDQKISELEDQNDKAAEQRQQQIDLLQGQLDYAEKYGLYWDKIYGMLYTFDENGNAVLNSDNFDLDGNIRKNSELDKLLGTFSDRIGMSAWSTVLDAEELDYLGKYYGAFIEYNGVTGDWKNAWALRDPGAADPNYAYPEQEIPDGLWGALYRLEIALKKNSIHNNPDIINRGGRLEESFKNFFGKLFGNEEWANYEYEPTSAAHVQSTFFAGMKEDLDGIKAWFSGNNSSTRSGIASNAKSISLNSGGTQNYGDTNVNNHFNIGSVGESVSLDDLTNRMTNIFKDMFSTGNNVLRNGH